MDDLLVEFLTETSESLATIDVELVKFEQNPNDEDILSNIFRLVHTIKGTCGFLGLPRLEKVAHAGENVLGKFRDGVLEVTPDAVTLILACIDQIKELLSTLEETETEPEGDDQDLIDRLNDMAEGREPGEEAEAPAAVADDAEPAAAKPAVTGGPLLSEDGFPIAADFMAEFEEAIAAGVTAPPERKPRKSAAAAAPAPEPEAVEVEAKPSVPAKSGASAPKGEAKIAKESSVASQTIRVNVDVLENLMTLVSELVLTRNQLLQIVRGQENSEFTVPLQRLSHITTDLQEGVMKTRMQPIGNAWAKLPRIVRDLSVETGKKIDLQMVGAETELDRQVLDLIKDPLTHMVRNSADHGLEDPADRRAAGKTETGVIKLIAFHEGGHIIIEISDDGRGLNLERIREKVIMNNLASEADVDNMSAQQIQQFIFRAGFSTAAVVTSVSGRGVGMDVVRTNIEKIGGTIELKSVEGSGSTFTIKIPLTLAIVSALIVQSGPERFAIPQISVVELVRSSVNSENAIENINDAQVLRLRNRLLPLVSLFDLLKLGGDRKDHLEEDTFIVVTQVGTYTFGIIVDKVFDTEEIVVKPVAPVLRSIPVYSGNTILGDGSVIMILDPNGIATATGEGSMASDRSEEDQATRVAARGEESTSMLIFKAGSQDLKAVPLALVARLEEIELAEVEHSSGNPVVQYRGQLMPLVTMTETHEWREKGRQPVLVFTDQERSMGLVVDAIVDIVEERLKIELGADKPGLIGSAIIQGKATDVIDAGHYLTQAFSDWFGGDDGDTFGADGSGRSILLVDDSPFFRNLLTPLLSVAGYKVTSVESADIALRLREDGAEFDIIISDIEMPGMTGFDFAKDVRDSGLWVDTPMIALSSHATETDFERGREVGFTDYVAKFDRDALLATLGNLVSAANSKE